MIVYRTVRFTELISLMVGETIIGREQKSPNCYENINGKEISMFEENKSCVCAFLDFLFYKGYESENIMLKLNIPDNTINYGYGDYFSPIYNNYLSGDPCYLYSEFGPNARFRGLLKTRIKEVHFPKYDISNVIGVYFPYHVKVSTELGYVDNCNETPFCLGEFIHKYFLQLKKICRKKFSMQYQPTYEYLDCLPFELSISTTKKIIKNELLTNEVLKVCDLPIGEIIRVVNNFHFYSGDDFSAKLDKPNTINYMNRRIDYRALVFLLRDVFEDSVFYKLEIKELPNFDSANKRLQRLYLEFVAFAHNYDFWPLILENESKTKNLFYALCVDAHIL